MHTFYDAIFPHRSFPPAIETIDRSIDRSLSLSLSLSLSRWSARQELSLLKRHTVDEALETSVLSRTQCKWRGEGGREGSRVQLPHQR